MAAFSGAVGKLASLLSHLINGQTQAITPVAPIVEKPDGSSCNLQGNASGDLKAEITAAALPSGAATSAKQDSQITQETAINTALGTTADAAVQDAAGTVNAHLRGIAADAQTLMARAPLVVTNADAGVAFTVADLLTWKKIGEISTDTGFIGDCRLAVQVDCDAANPTKQYGDSVEVALVPYYSPTGTDDPAASEAPNLACAIAWLWGAGTAAAPFTALDPWTRAKMRTVMTATGRPARRWIAYARVGMAAGEACTTTVTARLVGTLNQVSGTPVEKINPLCTVPPFVAGVKGAIDGTIFPDSDGAALGPSLQPSLSPRKWVSKKYTGNSGTGAVLIPARIFGGPWKISHNLSHSAGGNVSLQSYEINGAKTEYTVPSLANAAIATPHAVQWGYQYNANIAPYVFWQGGSLYFTQASGGDSTYTLQLCARWGAEG